MNDMSETEFIEKMRKHIVSVENKVKPAKDGLVPYEIFHATNDIILENMKELYSMLHEMNMRRDFTIDFKIGDINVILSSSGEDKEDLIKTAERMIADLLSRIEKVQTDFKKIEQRKKDETDKAFC